MTTYFESIPRWRVEKAGFYNTKKSNELYIATLRESEKEMSWLFIIGRESLVRNLCHSIFKLFSVRWEAKRELYTVTRLTIIIISKWKYLLDDKKRDVERVGRIRQERQFRDQRKRRGFRMVWNFNQIKKSRRKILLEQISWVEADHEEMGANSSRFEKDGLRKRSLMQSHNVPCASSQFATWRRDGKNSSRPCHGLTHWQPDRLVSCGV